MASTPGWKDYAWHRTKQLDADTTGLWAGIANDLVKQMKEKNAQTKERNDKQQTDHRGTNAGVGISRVDEARQHQVVTSLFAGE